MPLVDREGRVLGRWNVIDTALALFVLALVPLAYGAYVLFRTPPPRLVSIEPATLVTGDALRVKVRGDNLRPYMRVSFNDIQGNSFIFRNASEALVDLNPMPPGVYDVVLYDESQERSRLSQAFTLMPSPLPASHVMLIGTFGNLTEDRAAQLKAGMAVTNVGEIVQIGAPMPEITRILTGPVLEIPIDNAVRVPAAVRVACKVTAPIGTPQCAIADAPLQVSALIVMTTPIGKLPFQIDQVRGPQPLEKVRVVAQFVNRSEVIDQMRNADTDFGQYMNPLAAGATVTDLRNRSRVGDATDRVEATLDVPAQRGSSSWVYASTPLRSGAAIVLRTPRYELQGLILTIAPQWTASTSSTNGSSQ